MTIRSKDFTKAVHSGIKIDPLTGAVSPSIAPSTTFRQISCGVHKGFDYSRADNPTRKQLESALCVLEGSQYALCFSSGLAAIQAVMQLKKAGDKIIVGSDVYGGTRRLCEKILSKFGLEFEFVDMLDLDNLEASLKNSNHQSRLVWLETPTNPMLQVIDLSRAAKICKKYHSLLAVDNTFASPMFQKPMEFNVDIVVHSTTKYLGGHGDLVGGCIMCNNDQIYQDLKLIQYGCGAVPSVFDCYLLLRSLNTLAVRMQKHNENAMIIADYLQSHKKIKQVIFPGLSTHPQHQLAKQQMLGFSGIISFYYDGNRTETYEMCKRTKLFVLAESLGSCKSMINHPETMTHASVSEHIRKKLGIDYNFLRLSVGIEDANDLIKDLELAL